MDVLFSDPKRDSTLLTALLTDTVKYSNIVKYCADSFRLFRCIFIVFV